jgi:hypothetical protein
MGAAISLVAAGLLAAACVEVGLPADCDEPAVTREATLTSRARLVPSNVDVCRDQEVTLVVEPEADGVLHIHGYDEAVPATSVHVRQELTLVFMAGRSGQFVIELHPAGDPTGASIGILTMHEP